jgi:hypothetical protein
MSKNCPRFCDFADEKPQLEGTKKKITDILNTEILITDFRVGNSRYKNKKYLTLQFKNSGETSIMFTGSEVLIEQAQKYETKMPFYTTIVQRGKYYTMT